MRYKPIIGFLFVSITLTSCTLFKTSCRQNTAKKQTNADSTSIIYNDSVDNILLNASEVCLYDMADFVNKHDSLEKHDSIFNYEIKKNMGIIRQKEKEVLAFIISDRKLYMKKYEPIKHPFHPNITLEFTNKQSKAYMFISFATGEIAISTINQPLRFYLMSTIRPMARWAYMLFPEEKYYKELIKL